MKLEEITDIVINAGKITLVNGADIMRVETTMSKILEAYGFKGELLVTVYGIFVTVFDKDGSASLTRVKKISSRTIHLSRLEDINNFSRMICSTQMDYSCAMSMLSEIEQSKSFSFSVKLFAAGAMAFVFMFFFSSTVPEAFMASILGMLVYALLEKFLYKFSFTFIEYFLASLISVVLCSVTANLFPPLNMLKLIIGVLIILLPGGIVANSIKNTLNGDIISGSFMFAEALSILFALAAGTGLALSILWRW